MCAVCGCSKGHTRVEEHSLKPVRVHAAGIELTRMVQIEQDIMSKNDEFAQANRALFAQKQTLALNLMSSPGSGKTTLLVQTLQDLTPQFNFSVIEGDQESSQDAERIRATGVQAIQVNTGKGCHLDGHMVGHALPSLPLQPGSVLFIENVGNLVCPAGFDLGESFKIAILSVTEGEDKPIKYPDMFAVADVLLLNKIDLLPYVNFDVDRCVEYARRVNPNIQVIQVSATTGAGMAQWYQWISERIISGPSEY